jgi:hypothetical protein
MLVDGAGLVRELVLPVREEEVERVVGEWDRLVRKEEADAAGVRAYS